MDRLNGQSTLIEIIASQLHHTPLPHQIDNWNAVIAPAQRHSVLPFVASFAQTAGGDMPEPVRRKLSEYFIAETLRSTNQLAFLDELQAVLENSGIDNMAVKGAVTKRRYESDILRTMGDIDLLYRARDDKAFRGVMQRVGYEKADRGRKNDIYHIPPFVVLEAHRELVEPDSPYAAYYRGCWQRAKLREGTQHTYQMTLEDELIFNIVHLAEHFKEGGAGIRFIIDVYIYSALDMNHSYLRGELQKLGLESFYENMLRLARHWFDGAAADDLTKRLASFILSGGVFGSVDHSASLAVEQGKVKRFFRVTFPNYQSMKSMYPWLEGKPFLLPAAWISRGCGAITGRRKNIHTQMNLLKKGDTRQGKALRQFYRECGL